MIKLLYLLQEMIDSISERDLNNRQIIFIDNNCHNFNFVTEIIEQRINRGIPILSALNTILINTKKPKKLQRKLISFAKHHIHEDQFATYKIKLSHAIMIIENNISSKKKDILDYDFLYRPISDELIKIHTLNKIRDKQKEVLHKLNKGEYNG